MTTPIPASLSQLQVRLRTIEARFPTPPRSAPATATTAFDQVLEAVAANPAATPAPSPTAARAGAAAMAAGSAGTVTSSGRALRDLASGYVGIPYRWGGTDPTTGLDCSGFTQHLLRRVGVELPRVSADQLRTGTPVPNLAAARPGDLLGWDTGPRNRGADHVALYLGDGMMIEAPGTGGHVRIVPVRTPDAISRVLPDDRDRSGSASWS